LRRRRSAAGAPAAIFAALGDKRRLGLVSRLSARGPMSIAKLAAGSDVTRQAITKHLRTLERAGIVRGERSGRKSIWQIETRRLEAARRVLDAISKQWDSALGRLKALVEE
jgi:DNA-binding transcriptional ArsR family regulator